MRVPLPEAPQGEAIAFAANDRDLLVAGEGLPSTVTLVPASGELTTAGASAPAPEAAVPAAESRGVTPLTAGLIAAVIATLVVWLGGKLRRRE